MTNSLIPESVQPNAANYDFFGCSVDETFSRITKIACDLLGVPIAVISIAGQERVWMSPEQDPALAETIRSAILVPLSLLKNVVADLVSENIRINDEVSAKLTSTRFYAAAPMRASSGAHIGFLCALDNLPRSLSESRKAILRDLASLAAEHYEMSSAGSRVARAHDSIQKIASSAHLRTGSEYFGSVLTQLTGTLNVECAFAATLIGTAPQRARTLAVLVDGEPLPHFEYDVAGTPCEDVLANNIACYSGDAHCRFPADEMLDVYGMKSYAGTTLVGPDGEVIGWLGVTSRTPFPEPEVVASTLKFVATQISSELVRMRCESELRTQQQELERHVAARTAELTAANDRLQREAEDREKAEQALRISQERYELAARGANDGLWDWDLLENTIWFSPRWKTMIGFAPQELEDSLHSWFGRIHPDDVDRVLSEIDAHLGGATGHLESEHRIQHQDGSYLWMLCRGIAARDAEGRATRMAAWQTDITERKLIEQQLLHDAFHDQLTDLPNRALFLDHLEHALAVTERRKDFQFAVLFLDLDRFKNVNDSFGHGAGDSLLREVSRRLRKSVRPGDTVARLGGDEFTVLLEDLDDPGDATRIAQRILDELAVPISLYGEELFVTASIGIAFSTLQSESAENLLRDADTAMFRAKSFGKGCFEVFTPQMHEHVVERLRTEMDLRKAIEREELGLVYQPVVNLKNGNIIGFEALARWFHPVRGVVYPGEFIPVAEDSGLITAIGHLVLTKACAQLHYWNVMFPKRPLSVSVNLSAKQLTQANLIEDIEQTVRSFEIDPSTLVLEITETAVMENAETAAALFAQMRKLGIHLYIDDFGMGHSSLSYLQQFPVDALKIDRSFTSKMQANSENLEIVRTVVNLAHNLRLDVIAEGVETPDQLLQLTRLDCDFAQGYYFSIPVGADSAESLIDRGRLPVVPDTLEH